MAAFATVDELGEAANLIGSGALPVFDGNGYHSFDNGATWYDQSGNQWSDTPAPAQPSYGGMQSGGYDLGGLSGSTGTAAMAPTPYYIASPTSGMQGDGLGHFWDEGKQAWVNQDGSNYVSATNDVGNPWEPYQPTVYPSPADQGLFDLHTNWTPVGSYGVSEIGAATPETLAGKAAWEQEHPELAYLNDPSYADNLLPTGTGIIGEGYDRNGNPLPAGWNAPSATNWSLGDIAGNVARNFLPAMTTNYAPPEVQALEEQLPNPWYFPARDVAESLGQPATWAGFTALPAVGAGELGAAAVGRGLIGADIAARATDEFLPDEANPYGLTSMAAGFAGFGLGAEGGRIANALKEGAVKLDTRINEPAYLRDASGMEAGGMTVYHGSNGPLEGPIREGTFVTPNEADAAKFAEYETRLHGGEPTVHAFEADPSALKPVEGSWVPDAMQVAKPEAVVPKEPKPIYLHGTGENFSEFSGGRHGAVYLSEPTPGRLTQAEHIAGRSGRLAKVTIDESRVKAFDPLNDPQAKAIYEAIVVPSERRGDLVPYPDMPEVVRAAGSQGYNSFRVFEPSVQGVSRAITDPSLLTVVENAPYAKGAPPYTARASEPPRPPRPPAKPVGNRALPEGTPVTFLNREWEVAKAAPANSRTIILRDAEGNMRPATREIVKERVSAPGSEVRQPTRAELDTFARENLNVPTPPKLTAVERRVLSRKLQDAGYTSAERRNIYQHATIEDIADFKRKLADGEAFEPSPSKAAAVAAAGEMPPPKPPPPTEGGGAGAGGAGGGGEAAALAAKHAAWEHVVDALNLPRVVLASWDLSAPLRQGLVESVAHPRSALKATGAMLKALRSDDFANAVQKSIRESPLAAVREKAGLYLAGYGEHASLNLREEAFLSRWAGKIPGIRASERAYVTYLDKLRADVFDRFANANPHATEAELREYAQFVNHATGRGTGRVLDSIGPTANAFFFAPRYAVSRFQTPIDFLKALTLNTAAKRQIARDFGTFIAAGAGGLALLSQIPGVKVSLDPTSADFGKVRVGDMRWDFWAGFQQTGRLGFNLAAALKDGDTHEADDIFRRWLRTKAAPAAGAYIDWHEGQSLIGHNIGVGDLDFDNPLIRNAVPLFLQDVISAFEHEGLLGAVKALPAFLGVGAQDYADSPYKDRNDLANKMFGKDYFDLPKYNDPGKPSQQAVDDARGGKIPSTNPDTLRRQAAEAQLHAENVATQKEIDTLPPGPDWRDAYHKLQADVHGQYRGINAALPYTGPESTEPQRMALDEWGKVIDKNTFAEKTNWDAVDAWLAANPEKAALVDSYLRNKPSSDLTGKVTQYHQAYETVQQSGYFDIRDKAWTAVVERYPSISKYGNDWDAVKQAGVQTLFDQYRAITPATASDAEVMERARRDFDKTNVAKDMAKAASYYRDQWAHANPDAASVALEWGYYTPKDEILSWLASQ